MPRSQIYTVAGRSFRDISQGHQSTGRPRSIRPDMNRNQMEVDGPPPPKNRSKAKTEQLQLDRLLRLHGRVSWEIRYPDIMRLLDSWISKEPADRRLTYEGGETRILMEFRLRTGWRRTVVSKQWGPSLGGHPQNYFLLETKRLVKWRHFDYSDDFNP